MKINRRVLTFLTVALLSSLPTLSRAQEATPDATTSDSDTNTPPTLKELMAASSQVTNTVGIVLVKISPTRWAGMYEVTQEAYQKVRGGNPSAFQGGNHPVDSVNWNDTMAFCEKLTEKEQKAGELPKGYVYTLPTESQWEQFVGNASLSDAVMSLSMPRRSSTEPVGSLGPNSLGLYDTRGNVMEFCLDSHDPTRYRVLRGGAWDTLDEPSSRIDFRKYATPDEKKNDYGFRVMLELKVSQ